MKNTKGQIFWICFCCSKFFTRNKVLKILGLPVRLLYKIAFDWFFSIDIPDQTKIGNGFTLFHGHGLIISGDTIIGKNVWVRHNTTIGNAKYNGGSPIIKDNVQIGANSVVIGEITIGENAIIAAGSVVIKNVPKNTLVAGNPARIIKTLV